MSGANTPPEQPTPHLDALVRRLRAASGAECEPPTHVLEYRGQKVFLCDKCTALVEEAILLDQQVDQQVD